MNRFEYKILSEDAMKRLAMFRCLYIDIADHIETADKVDSRAMALALTHLEESFMWVGKMLRGI